MSELRFLPHSLAAVSNTIWRCWPTEAPLLPPTGVAGVVSLKPTPGASSVRIWNVAACATALNDTTATTHPRRAARPHAMKRSRIMGTSHGRAVQRLVELRFAGHALRRQRAVGIAAYHRRHHAA